MLAGRLVWVPNANEVHEKWLHKPGNLTLSGYNQELWNHPFQMKRERYADSNIVITRELAKQANWGEAEIRERGKRLAEEAAKMWPGPKEQVVRLEPEVIEDEGPDRHELRVAFWTSLGDYLSTEHPDLPKVEVHDRPSHRLASGVRHIGIDLQFSLKYRGVGVDIWFWRKASFPIWERLSTSADLLEELLATKCEFEQTDGRSHARISVWLPVPNLRKESTWIEAQRWIGEKLSVIFEQLLPFREEIELGEAV